MKVESIAECSPCIKQLSVLKTNFGLICVWRLKTDFTVVAALALLERKYAIMAMFDYLFKRKRPSDQRLFGGLRCWVFFYRYAWTSQEEWQAQGSVKI